MLQVRKLLGLGALLVSYLDGLDNYGALYWGDKRNLAMVRLDRKLMSPQVVAEGLGSVHLAAERQYLELSLLQPPWLSLMVSHRLMAR